MTLAEAENFHPEDGMVLANTTSVGMTPHTDATPLAKVCIMQKIFIILYYASNTRKYLPAEAEELII